MKSNYKIFVTRYEQKLRLVLNLQNVHAVGISVLGQFAHCFFLLNSI